MDDKIKMQIQKITEDIRDKLKGSRYMHTMGVMYTAASLAMKYDADPEQALLAGLLHDCGKYPSFDKQKEECIRLGITLDTYEQENHSLIHARLGSVLAQKRYGIEDSAVIDAIRYHTTGKANMSVLEKIIYIADYIEPHRENIPHLSFIRKTAFTDLDHAVFLEAKNTLSFLKESGKSVHPNTLDVFEYYKPE